MPLGRFTAKAQAAIERAQQMAMERNQGEIRALHLLYVLLDEEDSGPRGILEKELKVNVENFLKKILEEIIKLPRIFSVGKGFGPMYLSQEMLQIIEVTAKKAMEGKNEFISPEYLFYGILASKNSARALINEFNINKEEYLEALRHYTNGEKITDEFQEVGVSAIEKYTQDLTQLAKENKLDPVIGREEELLRVMQILSRRTKNNPILMGEAGVGKTAIVEGLAQRIASSEVPESLINKKIISLDLGALIAGTRFRGEFEERLKNLLKEIKKAGNIIIFIDEIHTLVGAGAAEGAIDASNLLKPSLARGELRAIGAATFKDYREYIEKDPALERRFQPVLVEEPTIEEAVEILRGLKSKYEAHHGLKISDEAIIMAVQLSSRYIMSRFLPDKAIDLIDEAASSMSLEIGSVPLPISELGTKIKSLELQKEAHKKEKRGSKKITQNRRKIEAELKKLKQEYNEIKKKWQNEKGIFNEVSAIKKEIEQLEKNAQELERTGQLDKVAEIIYGKIPQLRKTLKSNGKTLSKISEEERFLKDEVTAEDIARVVSKWTGIPVTRMLEEESKKLVRMEKDLNKRVVGQKEAIFAVSRAIRRARAGISEEDRPIGSFMFLGPTGVGKTELARALAEFMFSNEKAMIRIDMSEYMEKHRKHRPYSLILFDEIEKAHPEVFNILLQVLDNGCLTDGKGRTVNFKNTIIIMTSNLGGEYLQEMASLGFVINKKNKVEQQKEELKDKIHDALREKFRPEFLNRVDEIVIFNPLSIQSIEKIVDLQISIINHRLANKGIVLKLKKEAKKYLAQKGYNPDYGARPLKRLIEKEALDPLADEIIKGKIKEGDKIIVSLEKNTLNLCKS